jgi:thiol-disulfide isomerase/thioredoxin
MRIITSLSFLLLIACGTEQSQEGAYTIDTTKPLVERIRLIDLEGNELPLEGFKGKTVFLNFWATWCKPCLKEMPSMDRAYQQLSEENIVFIVASDEDMKKIKKYASGKDYAFQFAQLQGDIFDLDIKALPTTFIINPEGAIVYNEVGAREWDEPANITMLKKLIK